MAYNFVPNAGNSNEFEDTAGPTPNTLGTGQVSTLGSQQVQQDQQLGRLAVYGLPGLAAGLVDTMGTSVGVLKDSDVSNTLTSVFGPQGFGDWYARNRTPIRTASDIVGMAIPGTLGMKVLKGARWARETGVFGDFLKNSTTADALLGSSTRLTQLQQGVTDAATNASADVGIITGRTLNSAATSAAKNAYYRGQFAESLRQSAVFDAAYGGLYNNSVLMPSDQTTADYAKWGVAGAAFQSGIDFVAARFAVNKIFRGVWDTARTLSPLEETLANTTFHTGERGIGISTYAAARNDSYAVTQAPGFTATNRSNATSDISVIDGVLRKQFDGVASDPYPLDMAPKINLTDDQHQVLRNTLTDNPLAFVGAKKFTALPGDKDSFLADIADQRSYNETMRSEIPTLLQHGKAITPEQAGALQGQFDTVLNALDNYRYVVEGDGSINNYSTRAARFFDNHDMSDITAGSFTPKAATQDTTSSFWGDEGAPARRLSTPSPQTGSIQPVKFLHTTSDAGNDIRIDHNFNITMPQNPVQEDFDALQAVGSKMINSWKASPVQPSIVLSPQRPWRELDLIASVGQKNPDINAHISLDGFHDMDDVLLHITNERYQEFRRGINNVLGGVTKTALRALNKSGMLPEEFLQRLNMPAGTYDRMSPLTSFFSDMAASGTKDLGEIFDGVSPTESKVDLLQAAVRESAGISDPGIKPALTGNMWMQNDIKPILVHADNIPTLPRSNSFLAAETTQLRQHQVAQLAAVTAEQAPVVNATVSSISGIAALDSARDVEGLFEGSQMGKGVMGYADRVNQYNNTMKSLQLVTQYNDQIIQNVTAKQLESQAPFTAALTSRENIADAIDVNRVQQSYRHGYVVKSVDFVPVAGDTGQNVTHFILDKDDPRNLSAIQLYFGKDAIPPSNANGDWLMPDMALSQRNAGNIIPLEVSENAGAAAKNLSDLTLQQGSEANVIRQMLGLPPIQLRDFHLPAPELYSDKAWFVQNSQGKTINIYSRGTAATNESLAKDASDLLTNQTGEIHTAINSATVQRQAAADASMFNIMDYSDFLNKNSAMHGGLIETQIDRTPQSYLDMVKSLTNNYLAVGTRARALLLEPQLNYARMAASVTPESGFLKEYNIFDRYVATAYSRSTRNPNGTMAQLYGKIENTTDALLSVAYNAWTGLKGAAGEELQSFLKKNIEPKEYAQYMAKAQAYSPFNNVAQWLESTYKPQAPWTTRATLAEVSKVSNALAIRMLNGGTPLLNYLGVATVLPAVVASMRRRPGEADADFMARNGAFGMDLGRLDSNGNFAFSPMKALAQGFKHEFDGSLTEPMNRAAAMGMLDPEYTSIDRILSQEKTGTKSGLDNFINAASMLADKSETHSRKIVWGIGYSMAKDMIGYQDERNQFIFAQHLVNQVIGNYSPQNKPGIFQGALGMPLGAFQTYMFNYYRRLLSYVENRDVRAIGTQFALQGSVFGAAGLPGWNAWNQYIGSDGIQSDTLEGRINRNLPPMASELLLHGSVSNIPRLFGQDGIALYSRGSVDMSKYMPTVGSYAGVTPTPLTYLYDANKLPPIQLITNMGNIMQQTASNFLNGFSLQQQEEILSHYSTNRFIKNVMDMAANSATDKSGQVIANGTMDFMHLAATLAGSVPSQERALQDAYYQQKIVDANQSGLRQELNQRTRAMIRSGNYGIADMQKAVYDYTRSGGDPAEFGNWLRNNTITATQSKTSLKLRSLMSSAQGIEFQNMLAAMQKEPDNSDIEPVSPDLQDTSSGR